METKKALVIGAGLAGCYIAHELAKRGFLVTLMDEAGSYGSGASQNQHALLYPQFSSSVSPLPNFMRAAYLFALRTYPNFLKKWPIGNLSGLLQLAYCEKERLRHAKLQTWLGGFPELGRLVSAQEASRLAGIELQTGGIFVQASGWLNMPRLCHFLVQEMPGIQWFPNERILSLIYDNGEWHAGEHHAEVVVIANGHKSSGFEQTSHLPLQAVHGQMTAMASNLHSQGLKIPLCASGHILPADGGVHVLGATYTPGRADTICDESNDQRNLGQLSSFSTDIDWSLTVRGHWSGIRAATPDYLPLLGAVAKEAVFKQRFQGLAKDAKRRISDIGVFHAGLYICSGFGSRGLTTIPMCAEWLAGLINNEPSSLPSSMVQSFSPDRFLRRELIRGLC